MGRGVDPDGPTVLVVGAGYQGKRRYYERLAALGPRLVIVDEPGDAELERTGGRPESEPGGRFCRPHLPSRARPFDSGSPFRQALSP